MTLNLCAQSRGNNRYEVGVGVAPPLTAYITNDGGINVGFQAEAFIEWRHISGKHFEYGARLYNRVGACSFNPPYAIYNGVYDNCSILALSDIVLGSFFIGVGAGPSCDMRYYDKEGPSFSLDVNDVKRFNSRVGLVVGPRIGFEIKKRFRLSLDSYFTLLGSNIQPIQPICLNFGWVF